MKKKYSNPAHYRLDFIKENTLNTIWSIRMSRTRAILLWLGASAAAMALIWVIFAFTPLRGLLPGSLKGNLRSQYLETALKVDSLEQAARINEAYLANLMAIVNDELPVDSAMQHTAEKIYSDSLLAASEEEKLFVNSYREEERFNLSVLAPIAAEGMVFAHPAPGAVHLVDTPTGINMDAAAQPLAVAAPYRGTVVSVSTGMDGLSSVSIQHPNDFITVVGGLSEVYVSKGSKLAAAQRIGSTNGKWPASFELWHSGTALKPREYIAL